MKKITLYLTFALAIVISLSFTNDSNTFEGKVTYQLSYTNLPPEVEPYKGMLPSNTTFYIKGHLARMEQAGMGVQNVILTDAKLRSKTMLLDYMGDKVWVNVSEKNEIPIITYLSESKKIAGYNCKKAQLSFNDASKNSFVYYTEELPLQENEMFPGLKGFPLEYEITAGKFNATITASTVERFTIKDSKFTIPKEYREITKEQLKEMYRGGLKH